MIIPIYLFVAIFLSLESQSAGRPSTKTPATLEKAFHARLSFDTARFQIRREDHRVSMGHVPLVSRHEYQWGGEDLQFTDFGNDDGVRRVDPRTGTWPLGVAYVCLPERLLLNPADNTLFTHREGDGIVSLEKAKEWPTYVDIRTAGLRAIEIQRVDPIKMLALLNRGSFEFSEKKKANGIALVTGVRDKDSDGTQFDFEWEIDVTKSYSVTSAKEWYTNTEGQRRLVFTCNTDVKLIDNHWWPARVEYVSLHSGNRSVISFDTIEFNRPEHPKRLTLESMGIPIGAPIWGTDARYRYVGSKLLLPEADWKAVEDQFDLTALKTWQLRMNSMSKGELPAWWATADESLGIDDLPSRIDAWEAYVRRWIMKRITSRAWVVPEPLTEGQKNAALGVLADCRARAVAVQLRLTDERRELEAQIAAAEIGGSAATSQSITKAESGKTSPKGPSESRQGDIDKKARLADLKMKLELLNKSQDIPVLFEELKRRLDGILTEKQRTGPGGQLQRGLPLSLSKPPK